MAAVGELLLSAFFDVLFDKLASGELLNLARQFQVGVHLEVRKWEKTLRMIQAVLSDAEEKQLVDRAVKIWLEDLQDLAYDADDILDEFAYEALRRKLVGEHQTITRKASNFFPSCFSSLKFNARMESKIKDITSRLEQLCKQRLELGLQSIHGVTTSTAAAAKQRPPTTCVPTEPAVYGRDEDKAKILKMLLTDEPSDANFRVISIVGMGGIGKTTLAREVYNDKAVDDFKFDIKAWICVSDDFDVLSISTALLESITSSPCDLKTLNEVQVKLKMAIDGRKFFLVLDDVWNEEYDLWESLKSPFMGGAPGSKIIVTTRAAKVASTMGPLEHYNIKLLTDDDCWALVMKHASESRDTDVHRSLELYREKIVERCGGLPLAARTLGGLLRFKQREYSWEDILNSKIWALPKENSILPVLRLSYHHLPSHLKRCFAYCAVFPKDYQFDVKELVLLWVGEGVIQPLANNKQLENLGCEYFYDLSSRSIFQQSSVDSSKFVMHDLVHDLAQLVSGDTSLRLEEANTQSIRFNRVRHASYVCRYLDGKNKFQVLHKVEHLRTFLPLLMSDDSRTRFITNVAVSHILPKFQKLRVLSLRRYYITQLPKQIGDLIHLRYLNLSNTMIRSLPKSTSSLFYLQILILRDCCRLMRLPSNMRNLINLQHLDIRGVSLLKEMPFGMKELTYLHKLSNFIVGKGSASNLKDLKSLKFLCGRLCVSKLEKVIDLWDTKEFILRDKKDLKALLLEWGSQFDDSRNEEAEERVLHMMQPHKNIEELTIKYYGGVRFPSWVGDPSFSNVVVLKLENCEKCTSLPSLGFLGLLKDLTVEGMKALKSIGSEIYGKGCSKPFQSLEIIRFENLQEWQCWETIKESDQVDIFPCLRELFISRCPKLTGKLPDHLASLETLVVRNCAQLVVAYSNLPMLCMLEIDECKGMVCSSLIESKSLKSIILLKTPQFGNLLKQEFQKLEFLKIADCEELEYLWQNEIFLQKPPLVILSLTSMKELCIENCNAIKSLPEGVMHNNACLESLEIRRCDCMTFILRGKLPLSLKRLEISDCEKLQCVFGDREEDACTSSSSSLMTHKENIDGSSISLLESLSISHCSSLVCISLTGHLPATLKYIRISDCLELTSLSSISQLPEALEYLYVFNCSKLKSIAETFDSNTRLRQIFFARCANLQSIPEGLNNLTCLEWIRIHNCSSLVSLPKSELPSTISTITIGECEKLEDLPNRFHIAKSLQRLEIWRCPSIISFPEEGFPTNLTSLVIKNAKIYKPMIEWGLHNLTSLRLLGLGGCPDMLSFPQEDMGMVLPTSLTRLLIEEFPKLKYFSSMSFESLTSLEYLRIYDCPKLISFPKMGLPSSLLELHIRNCPLLKKRCKRGKGKDWYKIADIPCVMIDDRFVYDSEEEE